VDKLGINPTLLGYQLINFAIVMMLLNYLIFRPLSELLARRTSKIKAGLDKEGQIDEKLAQIDATSKKQLASTQKEIDKMMAKATAQAAKIKADLISLAKTEAQEIVARSRLQIMAEKSQIMSEAKQEIASLAIKTVEMVLTDSKSASKIKSEINDNLIDKLWQTQKK
jgi:F-type H+-transporting ATPase subunit b